MSSRLTLVSDRQVNAGRFSIHVRTGHWGDKEILTYACVRDVHTGQRLSVIDGPGSASEVINKVLDDLREYEWDLHAAIRALEGMEGGEG